MRNLPNMGLLIWDQLEDPYDHTQLANNFAKLDAHDHTPGRGPQLTSQSIEGEAITPGLLAAESVTTAKLAKESVTGEKIGAGGVKYEEKTAAERPAAGKKGRIFYATDTKVYSLDNGSAWTHLAPNVALEEGANPSFLSWGYITLGGGIAVSSGDFTAAKVGTGEIEIKWNVEKPSIEYCPVATPFFSAGGFVTVDPTLTTKAFKFHLWKASTVEHTAMNFSFYVIALA